MNLSVRETILGFDLVDGETPLAVYRAREHVPRSDSPKPCFAPIYTASGRLVTEFRPPDHTWHMGLFYGWVHANDCNLWGGGWYLPEKGRYEDVPGTHGIQRHDGFDEVGSSDGVASVRECVSWLDAGDRKIASERRAWDFEPCAGGYRWRIETVIQASGGPLTLGATRAEAHYSGLQLRLGPPFGTVAEPAIFRCSEGRTGHEEIRKEQANWVSAAGAAGGMIAIFDHPQNPRHPSRWHTRENQFGTAPLMDGDLTVDEGDTLRLRYRLLVLDEPVGADPLHEEYADFAGDSRSAA
jgi:hypothetical protein